ncbi:hypothetical protein Ahy_A03g011772 [Arachis hypogaea]|uniref:Aminotransferase-like plant mobile domain-containing protein n=1 Tax=Arachis hypogaea TaxID=3818 RepID=A0A445DRP3_ARAHY|nr:hypothetical protein Ahy_A03g011772 [Arachis hypogaea]
MAETRSLYRLNSVAHVADSINEEPTKGIYSVRRHQNMPLRDRIIPYLERAGCSILAGDAHDGLHVSGCLPDFEKLMEEGKQAWEWFQKLFGELPPQNKVTYLPTSDRKEERVVQCRLALDCLGDRDIVWEPYASLDVMAVVHPEIPTEEHSRLWRACTCLIYFAVIEWHQMDRVLPQLVGVQHEPKPASNIDWLHAKDGRGGDRWFPSYYQDDRSGGDEVDHANHRVWRGRSQRQGSTSGVASDGPGD